LNSSLLISIAEAGKTFAMKSVLVIGGAGEVGEGIVRQLLKKGHRVWVQSRDESRIRSLDERLGLPNLLPAVGDINTEREVHLLQVLVGEVDAVVASIGSWWSGPALVDLDLETYNRVMEERLTTHFLVAKTFLKSLQDRPGSSYTFIHGASGFVPIPNSGPVSIAGAGQVMLKDVFAKELEGKHVRINLLSMMGSIGTRSHPQADPQALTADDVGNYVAYLVGSDTRGQTIKFTHRKEIPG
jgi:3-oxoacyl-[acyl-carrier protein] reductase